ncbi:MULTISPECIES: hypothetical protein [Proteus]|uniref:hypothetical protein n=1 Tax=Proteus TaxID=583 RepID=UPI0013780278|nr:MULTISPECIES: hypothetical protein [Proteus]MDF7245184.1 hypothetical protein [Proteus mirabilis]MDF7317867.1 hypothetical protein [Proteus mirabilis]NBN86733.1 hypothetical protein [Proteus sp. G2300]
MNLKKILVFIMTLIALISCYIFIYENQFNRNVKAEWWIKNVYQKKINIADNNSSKKRIIIISGSNSLFGINSETITRITGIKTINLAIHAGLDLSFYRMMLEEVLKEGDIVIMPIEYDYYSKESKYTDWFIDNVLSWGDMYFKWLPLQEKIDFMAHTDYRRVFNAVLSGRQLNKTDPINKVNNFAGDETGDVRGYTYLALNKDGDINRNPYQNDYVKNLSEQSDAFYNILSYSKDKKYITNLTLNELNEIRILVASRGSSLYITWPAAMGSKFFNKSDEKSIEFSKTINNKLVENGFMVICDPFYGIMNTSRFTDTPYHPDVIGANYRSKLLGECIKNNINL